MDAESCKKNPQTWPVEPVSVEQIMLFLTRGEEA